MESFVGTKLAESIESLILACDSKPLTIQVSTSHKVLGNCDMRILRILEKENGFICLIGIY